MGLSSIDGGYAAVGWPSLSKLVAAVMLLAADPSVAAPSVTALHCRGKGEGYWNIALSEASKTATVYTYPAEKTETAPALFTDDEVKIDFAAKHPNIQFFWVIDRRTLRLRHFMGFGGTPAEEKFTASCTIAARPTRKF